MRLLLVVKQLVVAVIASRAFAVARLAESPIRPSFGPCQLRLLPSFLFNYLLKTFKFQSTQFY
jgi:hypothetical protein